MQNRKRDTDVQNSLLDSVGEGEGGMFQENSIEICILSRVKQITGPGQMHETSARTWCTGKTLKDRVEREMGVGIGMGNTCKSMANSFQCMTEFTTNKKKKILPLVKVPRNSHQQAPKDFRYWNDQCRMGKYEMIMEIKELKTILKSRDDISCSKNPKKS